MKGESNPVPLGASLDGVVRSLQGGTPGGPGAARTIGGVFGRWGEIVGDTVAAHVEPVRLDRGRLIVEVSDPAWATQIRLLTDTVCQRIRDVTGTVVDAVEVRVTRPQRRS